MGGPKHHNKKQLYYRVFFLIVVILLLAYTFFLTRSRMVDNSLNMGLEMVGAFSARAEYSIRSYNIALAFASETLIQLVNNEIKQEEIFQWITWLDKEIKSNLNSKSAHTYITYKGGVICAGENKIHKSLAHHIDFSTKDILDMPYNTVSFSEIFQDEADHNIEKITIYKKIQIHNQDVIIATEFDIKELQGMWRDKEQIASVYTYFLLDPRGRIVFTTYNMNNINSHLGSLSSLKNIINEAGGNQGIIKKKYTDKKEYNIFFIRNTDNQYVSILIMPSGRLSYSKLESIRVYIYIILILVLIMLLFLMKDKRKDMQVDLSNDFINIIGSSYYAIFSINIKKNKYKTVKGESEILQYLPDTGEYTNLHKLIGTVVEKGTQDDFAETFSLENIKKLTKSGQVDFGGDFQRIVKNGYIWVKIRLIYNKDITEDYAVLCFKNRDHERKVELEHIEILENSIDAMKKSNKSKNIFYSGLSHDMRTPLNAILGLTELIKTDFYNKERVLDYVDKIQLSGSQLLSLIDNFLDYTKETYDAGSNSVEFNIEKYIETNLGIYYILAQKDNKKFELKWDISHKELLGDTSKLYRILNNLIMNSFKYTRSGDTISLEIIELQNQGRPKYKFIFRDTGIGMSKKFIKKIFSPYQREKRFDTKESAGVGLGMAIVENYVHLLDGEIEIESEINKGTNITITLPFDTAVKEKKQETEENTQDYAGNIEGLSILVAEDNNINMFILTELLTRNGCKVTQAWNGIETVEQFKNADPYTFDLILMDIQMPDMNGLDAAKNIRASDKEDAKNIPIIAVSANVYTEDVAASSAAGMNAHLAKPVNFNVLQKTVYSLISNKNKKN